TTEEITLAGGTYNIDEMVDEINTKIAANDNLSGLVEAVASGDALKFRTIGAAAGTDLTLNSGTNDVLGDLGFTTPGATATSGAVATGITDINDLLQTTGTLEGGEIFKIEGTDSNGNAISVDYSYTLGHTLNDLLDVINDAFAGKATAALVEGKIVLTDAVVGDSQTTINITADTDNAGVISIPGFINTVEGYTGRITTSAVVYDSLGKGHSLTMEFEKTENSCEWLWNLSCSGGEDILSGGSGKAIFDSDGNLISFTYDEGANKLSIDPKSGAGQMDIVIHGGATEGYSGISQFDSVSTLLSRDQDGRKSGSLKDFYVDSEGSVIGLFTNGEDLKLAQVALAQFNNPSGLMNAGGSNYIATAESGSPKVDAANNLGATIESGSLEVSTVDMADQFTKMIEAQRSYQAAARVITTFDQILEETTRLKR
ncbi:MAG TPA: hypothetical protein DHW42_01460, partial [Candidatus Marinimicrobia bacterium]|nr:hypothetical protein [Candidatus Neomarinimicrobiota bacterium]